jgi:DNA processing protein
MTTTPIDRTGTDEERVARATLMRVAEPGVPALTNHVATAGVLQTLADIRAGTSIEGVDVAGLQHRLRTASGAADLAAAARVGARLVAPGDAEWPALLDDLGWVSRESFGLWVRGEMPLADAVGLSVAVVGTRTASDYGAHVAAQLAGDLAGAGWTVVSGLAYGIDGAAHRAALAIGGLTVGVLACGIDVPYPAGHRSLYERVCAEGLVVTEHPPGAAPQRHRFLVRNRIIAALSAGTVVVEMAARSGAKSTAFHALAINRHVMCVPGPVTSPLSAGCHQLMRERPEVVLVTRASEVVEQCGHMGELADPQVGPSSTRDALGPMVARVFEGVPVRKSASIGSIAATAGVSVDVAGASLAALAAAGLVRQVDGGWSMTTEGGRDRHARRRSAAAELPFDW